MKNLFENWRRLVITEGNDLNWSSKCMIFDDAGRVMLVQVADKGTWDLPGGHGKNSETPIEAVKREVFEEVGLKIDQIQEIGQLNTKVKKYLFVALNFSGTFDLQLEEVSDYIWAPIEKIIIQINNSPKVFEDTIILAMKNYKHEIRQIRDEADKIKYYQEHPNFDPEDRNNQPSN